MVRWPDQMLAAAAESATMESTTVEPSTRGDGAVSHKAVPNRWTASLKAVSHKSASIGVSIISMSPAVVPRARADKDSAGKPVRAIVAVGCASIRIIRVIAVSASWRASHIARANAHSDTYSNSRPHDDRSLRISERHGQ